MRVTYMNIMSVTIKIRHCKGEVVIEYHSFLFNGEQEANFCLPLLTIICSVHFKLFTFYTV